jgi:hypothetical protein
MSKGAPIDKNALKRSDCRRQTIAPRRARPQFSWGRRLLENAGNSGETGEPARQEPHQIVVRRAAEISAVVTGNGKPSCKDLAWRSPPS